MRWRYEFEFDPDTDTLTVIYADGVGDVVDHVYVGDQLPEATLYARTNAKSGRLEGVKLVIPEWHSAQHFRLVQLFDLMGPDAPDEPDEE